MEIIAAWIKQGAKLDSGITPKADLLRELRIRWQPPEPPVAYKFPSNINAVVFTPDSKKLVTGGYHELLVWDIKSGKLKKRIHTRAERAYDLHFLPDGKLAVAGGRPGQEGDVRIYDLNGKSKMVDGIAFMDGVSDKSVFLAELVQTNDSMLSLDVSDDGKKLVAAGCDRLVRVWDLGKGVGNAKLEHKIENHADWVLSVNFSPNGRYLLTASRDKSAKVWDLQKKESLVTFQGHANIVYGAVMSTNHKLGISAGEDRNLRSWNTEVKSKKLGKQVRSGGGHAKPIFKLVEYRQGNNHLLATCSADGTVRLWDDNLRSKRTLSGFEDWVYALAISPNGELVAAGGWDGEIRVWQVKDGKLVQEFNASPGFVATSGK